MKKFIMLIFIVGACVGIMNGNSTNNETILLEMCKYGRTEKVKELLATGTYANTHACLEAAAAKGHIEIVKLLLKMGSPVDYNVLHTAVRNRHADIVKLLLGSSKINSSWLSARFFKDGININAQEGLHGETLLFEATEKGFPEIVKLLLDAGANPNTPTTSNRTPLMKASEMGNVEIVKLLLQAKAKVNIQEIVGRDLLGAIHTYTALMYAAKTGILMWLSYFL